jgi:2-dehydro-3-deoxyphosphogalactonate aldolase
MSPSPRGQFRPEGASDVGEALYEAGFRCLEVPLNSPRPLESIERLRESLDGSVLVGAGPESCPYGGGFDA